MKATVLASGGHAPELPARVRALATRLGRALALPKATLSVMLTDDAGVRDMNARFRGKDEATDVLSFPSDAGEADASGHYLGDVVVSLQTAEAQAQEHGHSLVEEVEVLVLHGVLHLLGHDHETDGGRMREVEARLARELLGSTRGLVARTQDDGTAR